MKLHYSETKKYSISAGNSYSRCFKDARFMELSQTLPTGPPPAPALDTMTQCYFFKASKHNLVSKKQRLVKFLKRTLTIILFLTTVFACKYLLICNGTAPFLMYILRPTFISTTF